MKRRDFMRGGATVAGAGVLAPGWSTLAQAAPVDLSFPKDFVFGCATAAYQIEGAVAVDGRGRSNWDVFAHTPGKIANGDTGDIACDSYHRYPQDIASLRDLGVGAYRFSIAWPRIFPDGRGKPNAKGVAYYDRLVDALLAAGITPHATMFHWDYPAALPGGWQNRDTAYALADYAGYMAGKLSDRVKHIMTVNELRCFTDLSHKEGLHAPGLKLPPAGVNQVRHHGVLAHGLAVQAIRAQAKPGTQVGIADNMIAFTPVMETPEHIAAAQKATRIENAMFLTAVMEGRYLDEYLAQEGAAAPKVKDGDMAIIASPLDFVSLNVYTPEWVRADDGPKGYKVVPHVASSPRMASPWLVVGPEAAYWTVRNVSEMWKPKALYISENGASADDTLAGDRVDDADRVMYLRGYLSQFRRVAVEGYPLKGYFLWSLMDNFEWADGYSKRFGIHYVDFASQRRVPKLSARWYREVIRRNRIV